jgi:hypothetical protein
MVLLDPVRLDALCEAIANKSVVWVAGHVGAEHHAALERRWCQIGGMLERSPGAWRITAW